jgi:CheY-like chemotaxis protein
MTEEMREPERADFQKATEAVSAHRASLADLRHELRTPLNAVIGYSEMLLDDAEDQGQEHLAPGLREIHSAGQGLLALVNQALDPAKIAVGELEVDLEVLGARLRGELLAPAEAIVGHSQALLEIVTQREQHDFIPDLQKICFAGERFLASITGVSEAETRAVDSDLESAGGRPAPLPEDGGDAPSVDRGFLLVVDDDEMNRDILSQYLEGEGHTVAMAIHGRQALEMVREQAFDIVLLDIMMPEMDGYQVLQRLKSDVALRHIPVIMISALDEIESVVRCIELGAEDYLPKPFNPVLLQARINACLEKKRLRDQEVEYLRNVALITDAAAAVEAETFALDDLADVATRPDALGRLARVFQRMARQVYTREQDLKQQVQQLRIELDEATQAQQVAEITETDYFQQLEARAQDLRRLIDAA